MDMELIFGIIKIIALVLIKVPLLAVVVISAMLFVLAIGIVCRWIETD